MENLYCKDINNCLDNLQKHCDAIKKLETEYTTLTLELDDNGCSESRQEEIFYKLDSLLIELEDESHKIKETLLLKDAYKALKANNKDYSKINFHTKQAFIKKFIRLFMQN